MSGKSSPTSTFGGAFPAHQLFTKLIGVGLFGLDYDEDIGGSEASHRFTAVTSEEPGRVTRSGARSAIAVQMSLATPAVQRFGLDELRARYLTPGLKGEAVASIAVTEPHPSSDVARIRTQAVREGNAWGDRQFEALHQQWDAELMLTISLVLQMIPLKGICCAISRSD